MKLKLLLTATQKSFIHDIPLETQIFSYIGALCQLDPEFMQTKIISVCAHGQQISPFLTVAEAKLKENDILVIHSDKIENSKNEVENILGSGIFPKVLEILNDVRELKVGEKVKKSLAKKVTELVFLVFDEKFETVKSVLKENSCVINNEISTNLKYINTGKSEYICPLDSESKKEGFGMYKGGEGNLYFGGYKDNERNGFGFEMKKFGNIAVSKNVNRKFNGYGFKIYQTGEIGQINYDYGKITGEETFTDINNNIIKRKWDKGKLMNVENTE